MPRQNIKREIQELKEEFNNFDFDDSLELEIENQDLILNICFKKDYQETLSKLRAYMMKEDVINALNTFMDSPGFKELIETQYGHFDHSDIIAKELDP